MCLDIESEIEEALSGFERSLNEFEELPDEPLGNGGLGRLAACFLDSAANLNVALDAVEEAAKKLVKVTGTEEPDPELVEKYNDRYAKFAKIYPTVKGLFDEVTI